MPTNQDLELEIQEINQRARLCVAQDQWEEAQKLFEQSLALDPMYAPTYDHKGCAYMARQDYPAACEQFKKALMLDKSLGETYFNLGNAYMLMNDLPNCIEQYNRAVTAGFNHADLHFYLALAYEETGDFSMALRQVTRAAMKDPTQPEYKVKKINLLARQGQWEEALEESRDLILACPELYEGYHLRTLILQQQDELAAALASAKEASELFPKDVSLLYDYAQCIALTGEWQKAFQLLKEAKSYEGFEAEQRSFTLLEAQLHAQKGDLDAALTAARACVAMERDGEFDSASRQMLMNLLVAAKEYDELYKVSNEVVTGSPENEFYRAALYYRAMAMKETGHADYQAAYDKAIRYYRAATLKEPSMVDAYLYRTMALKDLERYTDAMEIIDFLIKLVPRLAEAHTLKADICALMGDQTAAEACMAEAFRLKPELKELYKGRSEVN